MTTAATTKPQPDKRTQTAVRGDLSEPDNAMARARRIQAATSFTAAADIAILPTSVVSSLSSARMRAKTGKAVIESATPMNMRNAEAFTPLDMVPRRTNDDPIPNAKGTQIPVMAMPKAFFPVRRIDFRSNSRPTRKRKNNNPMFAMVSNNVILLDGNIV